MENIAPSYIDHHKTQLGLSRNLLNNLCLIKNSVVLADFLLLPRNTSELLFINFSKRMYSRITWCVHSKYADRIGNIYLALKPASPSRHAVGPAQPGEHLSTPNAGRSTQTRTKLSPQKRATKSSLVVPIARHKPSALDIDKILK